MPKLQDMNHLIPPDRGAPSSIGTDGIRGGTLRSNGGIRRDCKKSGHRPSNTVNKFCLDCWEDLQSTPSDEGTLN